MSDRTAAPTPPAESAITRLVSYAKELLGRVEAAILNRNTSYLPDKIARRVRKDSTKAMDRLEYALLLALAVTQTMGGNFKHLIVYAIRKPRAEGAPPAKPRESRPSRPTTQGMRDRANAGARARRMRHTLMTQPINKLARRLASALGIHPDSDLFPIGAIDCTETPAAYGQRLYGPMPKYKPLYFRQPKKAEKPKKDLRGSAPEPPPGSTDPEPHKREWPQTPGAQIHRRPQSAGADSRPKPGHTFRPHSFSMHWLHNAAPHRQCCKPAKHTQPRHPANEPTQPNDP